MIRLLGTCLVFVLSCSAAAEVGGLVCQQLNWSSVNPAVNNARAIKFKEALRVYQPMIRALYPEIRSHQDYYQLSQLAFAVMGPESSFYGGFWYNLKAWTPASALKVAKCLRRGICNWSVQLSSGPTQIKEIPVRAQIEFKITPESLYSNPAHAAIATLSFLVELRQQLEELRRREKYAAVLAAMNRGNMNDYLVYFYQGKGRRILNGEIPSPQKNGYLAAVQRELKQMRSTGAVCDEPLLVRTFSDLGEVRPGEIGVVGGLAEVEGFR